MHDCSNNHTYIFIVSSHARVLFMQNSKEAYNLRLKTPDAANCPENKEIYMDVHCC